MKKFLALLVLLTLSPLKALGSPPVIWDSACSSGIYNLAAGACLGTGTGTVSSVSGSSSFTITNATSTPNIAFSIWGPNFVLVGPATGPSGVPSPRPLVSADIPTLPYISTTLDTTATNGGMSVSGNTLAATQAGASTNGWVSSSQVTQWNTTIGNQVATATNTSGSTMTLGQIVYITGFTAGQPTISLAEANSPATMPGWGLIAQASCTNNSLCNVQVQGFLTMNTTGLTVGGTAYVSNTVAGALVGTQPTFSAGVAPLLQSVGLIDNVASSGQIYAVLQQPDGIQGGSRSSSWLLGPGTSGTVTMGADNGFTEVFSMNPTAARTITVPDATFTMPGLSIIQSWSAANSFAGGFTSFEQANFILETSADHSKKIEFTAAAESTAVTTTIGTGAQTASAQFNLPVNTAGDTLAGIGTAQAWSAGQAYTPVVATVTSSYAPNCASGNHFRLTMTSATNFTLSAPTNCKDGQRVMIELIQPASGTIDTVTISAYALGSLTYTVTPTLGKEDFLGFVWNNGTSHANILAIAQNYSP